MEIAYCLYRVSTKKQVDKEGNDIPMLKLFKEIKGAPQEERLKKIYKNKMAGNTARIKKLETGIAKDKKQLNILKLEIANCLVGNSAFSQSDLSEAMNTLRSRIDEAESQIKSLREDESYQERAMRKILPSFNQFKSWAEEFETATLKQKKMIACQLFKRIEVGKGYNINFEINLTYAEFFNNWESTKELIEQVG